VTAIVLWTLAGLCVFSALIIAIVCCKHGKKKKQSDGRGLYKPGTFGYFFCQDDERCYFFAEAACILQITSGICVCIEIRLFCYLEGGQ